MMVIRSVADMQSRAREWRRAGRSIACVPTMGYLHAGHLELVRVAREQADVVVVTLFVNPAQFGPSEDFQTYPRDFERDADLCRHAGVTALFCPETADMYPAHYSTWVVEEALSVPLCGQSRPGHFRGVTTVVAKLFNAVCPDVAVFGQKDGQQALVIGRMVRDLNFPLRVVVVPTVRETDGLALSSRNSCLASEERARATALSRGLRAAEQAFRQGERRADVLRELVRRELQAVEARIDYVELVARETLTRLDTVDEPAMLAVAAFVGRTRLLDNVLLG